MNIEELREYCLSLKGTTEEMPFGPDALVFKVMGKMFALTNLEGELSVNLKCDPEKAIELRDEFPCVLPGYHMNKKHWNTVKIDGSVPPGQILEWIDDSYELVVKGLPNKLKQKLMSDGTI
jgi:predicted DNA-binding protein (MmcQ/YjbR family)